MARSRRTYPPAFKAEAVQFITEQGYAIAEAARSLGVPQTVLRSGKQALQTQGDQAFPGQGKRPASADERRRRRVENQRLQAERDMVKKAAAFCARAAT